MAEAARRLYTTGWGIFLSFGLSAVFLGFAHLLFEPPEWLDNLTEYLSPTNDQLWLKVALLGIVILTSVSLTAYAWPKARPYGRWKLYSLCTVSLLVAIAILQGWLAILAFLVVFLTVIIATQLPVLYALLDDSEAADNLNGKQGHKWLLAIGATGLLISGLTMCYSAGSVASSRKKIADFKKRGLYADVKDVKMLLEDSKLQLANLDFPNRQYVNYQTVSFTSVVTSRGRRFEVLGTSVATREEHYAQVSDGTPLTKDLGQWPLWIHCNWPTCTLPGPFIVSIKYCDLPDSCPQDFQTAMRRIESRRKVSGGANKPSALRYLEYDNDANLTTNSWWLFAAGLSPTLILFQMLYTLGHLMQFLAARKR